MRDFACRLDWNRIPRSGYITVAQGCTNASSASVGATLGWSPRRRTAEQMALHPAEHCRGRNNPGPDFGLGNAPREIIVYRSADQWNGTSTQRRQTLAEARLCQRWATVM